MLKLISEISVGNELFLEDKKKVHLLCDISNRACPPRLVFFKINSRITTLDLLTGIVYTPNIYRHSEDNKVIMDNSRTNCFVLDQGKYFVLSNGQTKIAYGITGLSEDGFSTQKPPKDMLYPNGTRGTCCNRKYIVSYDYIFQTYSLYENLDFKG